MSQINIKNDVDDVASGKEKIKKTNYKEHYTECMINYLLFNEFKEILNKKFDNDYELVTNNLRDELNIVFMMGLQEYKKEHTSSSTSLLYNKRKPRRDVLKNLKNLSEFLQDYEEYPHFRKKKLLVVIRDVLGQLDPRTSTRYLNCIITNSISNKHSGTFDVKTFVNRF